MHNEIETPAQAGSNSLPDLAARIRAEHEAAEASYRKGIEHALVAGELLAEAKAKVQHGQWLSWLQNNCGISERMAQRYMKLHNERATLETKSDTVSDLTINEALVS